MRYAAKRDLAEPMSLNRSILQPLHPNAVELTGNRCGRLVVLGRASERINGRIAWRCRCDCGAHGEYSAKSLGGVNPRRTSCGCAAFTVSTRKTCPICGKQFLAQWRNDRKAHEKTCSPECAVKIRDFNGEKNPNWRNNSTVLNHSGRLTHRYQQWRWAVFNRDKKKCVQCGSGKNLHADHIKPWSTHVELRFEISNGRTLCAPCHRKTDTWGARAVRP